MDILEDLNSINNIQNLGPTHPSYVFWEVAYIMRTEMSKVYA